MLQHINKYTNGKTNQVLTTTSASRIKVSPSDFKKPCDYRVVQNRDLVTNDAQRRKEIVGVCTDYFLDDKESKKKQK